MSKTSLNPTPLTVDPDGIPHDLRSVTQWVCWKAENRGQKLTKVPYNPRGGRAKSTDPETWGIFEMALEAHLQGEADGVGFVFTADDVYAGIDLDHCFHAGELQDWASEIVDQFSTYTEFSPSGGGLHIYLKGSKHGRKCKRLGFPGNGVIELYDRARFFCVTGHRLSNSPADVRDCQQQFARLYAQLFPADSDGTLNASPIAVAPVVPFQDDDAIISRVTAAPKYAALWDGNTSEFDGDHSRADLAMVRRIALITGPDSVAIDRIFRRSALNRGKWENRDDYREKTISTALASLTDTERTRTSAELENAAVRINSITSSEFARRSYDREYLVPHILARGEPFIIGGAPKTLKTSVAVDLAVSLGTGTQFLGRFSAQRATVGMISGESGEATLQDSARRICRAKTCDLSDANIHWFFQCPCLADQRWQRALRRWIDASALDVVVVDPTYLALLTPETARSAANLMVMGTVLRGLTEAVRDTGVTLGLVHHVGKGAARNSASSHEPADLMDLSMSGFAEYARQWILITRREKYAVGSGEHRLVLNVGGSAGHSGLYAVDVSEGQMTDPGGRKWEVQVLDAGVAEADREEKRQAAKAKVRGQVDADLKQRVVEHLKATPDGETLNSLLRHIGGRRDKMERVLASMSEAGELEACQVQKHTRSEIGVRLACSDCSNVCSNA